MVLTFINKYIIFGLKHKSNVFKFQNLMHNIFVYSDVVDKILIILTCLI